MISFTASSCRKRAAVSLGKYRLDQQFTRLCWVLRIERAARNEVKVEMWRALIHTAIRNDFVPALMPSALPNDCGHQRKHFPHQSRVRHIHQLPHVFLRDDDDV